LAGAEAALARPRRYFVDTSKGFVHVQDCGAGERVVVFVTITSFGGVLLDQVLPLMAAKGYRALAVDLMGYGLSDKRATPWMIEDFADNILEAARLAGVTPTGYVFGHFSGLAGLEIAARAPAGLRGIVLDGTPLIDEALQAAHKPGDGPAPLAWTEDGAHGAELFRRAFGLIKRLNPDYELPAQPDNLTRQACLAYISVVAFEPGTFEGYVRFDARKRMKDVRLPVQVMCADTDWNLPHHSKYVEGIAGATEVRFAGVHPLHDLRRPERAPEYVAAIDAFFSRLP